MCMFVCMRDQDGVLSADSHRASQLCLSTWRGHGKSGAPLVFSSCCAPEAEAAAMAGGGGGSGSGCPGAQHFEALGKAGQPRQLRFAGASGRGDVCVTAPISNQRVGW